VKVEDIGCVLKAVENGRVGGKGVRDSNGRGEWAKVKYTRNGDTLRNPLKHRLKY
jgi:hypothetical protein